MIKVQIKFMTRKPKFFVAMSYFGIRWISFYGLAAGVHVLFKTEYLQPVYFNNPFRRPIPEAVKWKCIRRVCLFRPVPRAPFYPRTPPRSCKTSQHLSGAGRGRLGCLFPRTPNSCIKSAPVVAANLQKLLGVTNPFSGENQHTTCPRDAPRGLISSANIREFACLFSTKLAVPKPE
jgi:hypothetical protein